MQPNRSNQRPTDQLNEQSIQDVGTGVLEIKKSAQRLGLQWTLRPGTYQSDGTVLLDGDSAGIRSVNNLIGGSTTGARVMVLLVPPNSSYVIGRLSDDPALVAEENGVTTTGTTSSTSYTATLTGSTTPTVVFIAPANGKVWVNWTCQQLNSTATSSVFSTFEVREGSTIGSGNVFFSASDDYAIWTDPSDVGQNIVTATIRKLLTGLTPGKTYHARGMYRAGGGTSEYRSRWLSVEPAP